MRRSSLLAPLTQVQASIAPHLASLAPVPNLISDFLDISTLFTLSSAVARGSVRLVERVASRYFDDVVDSVDRENAFSHAFETAIQANDLVMVQLLDTFHPEPLEVSSLSLAMAHGSLDLIQWILEHRHDRVCSKPHLQNLCDACVKKAALSIGNNDTFRVATWLIDEGLIAVSDGSESNPFQLMMSGGLSIQALTALLQSAELVQWCDTKGFLTTTMANKLFSESLERPNAASADVVEYLLKAGYLSASPNDQHVDKLIQASCHPNQEALVDLVLKSSFFAPLRPHFVYASIASGGAKVLQWDQAYEKQRKEKSFFGMSSAVSAASTLGHLATIQWLTSQPHTKISASPNGRVSEQETLTTIKWLHTIGTGRWSKTTMDLAAAYGQLEVVKWLHENRSEGCSTGAMDYAGGNGHLHIVKWLHENRSEGCTSAVMHIAAANGHLSVVQWLLANDRGGNVTEAMAYAAINGQLDVVKLCLDHGGCARCLQHQLLTQPGNATRLSCLGDRLLYTLQWLDKHSTTAIGCVGRCLIVNAQFSSPSLAAVALQSADMLLLEYLHHTHKDVFAWSDDVMNDVMNTITAEGHLAPLPWLHARYPQNLNLHRLLELAEERENPHIMKWLQTITST